MTTTLTVEVDLPDEVELELEALDAIEEYCRGMGWMLKQTEAE